jgi:hypothetical protein
MLRDRQLQTLHPLSDLVKRSLNPMGFIASRMEKSF